MSRAPAELIGLHTVKGQIAPGFDADFVAWDPEAVFTVEESIIRHKNKVRANRGAFDSRRSSFVLDYAVHRARTPGKSASNVHQRAERLRLQNRSAPARRQDNSKINCTEKRIKRPNVTLQKQKPARALAGCVTHRMIAQLCPVSQHDVTEVGMT